VYFAVFNANQLIGFNGFSIKQIFCKITLHLCLYHVQ
jgi:hypothetical protein